MFQTGSGYNFVIRVAGNCFGHPGNVVNGSVSDFAYDADTFLVNNADHLFTMIMW